MSKMTPAAPPCMTSVTGSILLFHVSIFQLTVQVGEVGYYGHFIGARPIKTSVHQLQALHYFTVEVLADMSGYAKQMHQLAYYVTWWSPRCEKFVSVKHCFYSYHSFITICFGVAHLGVYVLSDVVATVKSNRRPSNARCIRPIIALWLAHGCVVGDRGGGATASAPSSTALEPQLHSTKARRVSCEPARYVKS
jgi:hypothetical protein